MFPGNYNFSWSGGGTDEGERTLDALLIEMNDFGKKYFSSSLQIGKNKKGEVLHKRWENNIESQEPQADMKNIIPKSDAVKIIIANTIKDNIIFSIWNENEILEFVNMFFEVHVLKKEIQSLMREPYEFCYTL